MKSQLKHTITRITSSLLLIPTLVWIYAPIVVGIIFHMIWMLPIAFTSWWIFGLFGSRSWVNSWIILDYLEYTPGVKTLIVFEFLIFTIGLALFIWGLFYIARARLKKEGLTTGGPYKYIRHPQHLGLIIMTFAISFYIPWTNDLGIRIGEILSWSIFVMILFIWSDYEERRLFRKFGQEYDNYRAQTNSFLPRILKKTKRSKSIQEIKYWKRYIIAFVIYICFILFMYLLVYILSLPGINIIQYIFDIL